MITGFSFNKDFTTKIVFSKTIACSSCFVVFGCVYLATHEPLNFYGYFIGTGISLDCLINNQEMMMNMSKCMHESTNY